MPTVLNVMHVDLCRVWIVEKNFGISYTALLQFCMNSKTENLAGRLIIEILCTVLILFYRGDEFLNHNQCISEAEKYSGKNYTPKPNKGLKKQEQWVDIIRNKLSVGEFPQYTGIMEKLLNCDNIPRKQKKFEVLFSYNFIPLF